MKKLAGRLLHDSDPTVRRAAAEECGQFAQTPGEHGDVVRLLVQGLRDPHVGVQEAVVESLSAFHPRLVVSQTLPLLKEDVVIRNLGLEILEKVGPAGVEYIATASSDPDPYIRKVVATILGHCGEASAGTVLASLLRDPDVNVRIEAAEGLGTLHYQPAFEPLMQMVADENGWASMSAISALGRLGDPRAIPILQQQLSGEDFAKQCFVVEALGEIGDKRVLPDLLDLLPFAAIPLRHYLFVTLIRLACNDAEVFHRWELREFLFDELVAALKSRDRDVQKAALQGLRLLGDSRATGALLAFMRRGGPPEDMIRAAVLDALCHMGDDRELMVAAQDHEEHVALVCLEALGARRPACALPVLRELVRTSENREIRRAALMALGRIGVTGDDQVVIDALQDLTGTIRKEAARIVAENGMTGAEPVLWNRLDDEPYPDVAEEYVRALVCLQHGRGGSGLSGLLNHGRTVIREAAIASWPDLHSRDVCQLIRERVHDSHWQVRLRAVERLAESDAPEMLDDLLRAAADEHPFVRQAAIAGLEGRPTERVRQALCDVAKCDADLWARIRAVEALAQHDHPLVRSALIGLVEEAPVPLQMAIAHSLGLMRATESRAVLDRMCRFGEPDVVQSAKWALEKLGGVPVNHGVVV